MAMREETVDRHARSRGRAVPKKQQLKHWAQALRLAAEVAAECSDTHFSIPLSMQDRLR